jgi:hypothetical protein
MGSLRKAILTSSGEPVCNGSTVASGVGFIVAAVGARVAEGCADSSGPGVEAVLPGSGAAIRLPSMDFGPCWAATAAPTTTATTETAATTATSGPFVDLNVVRPLGSVQSVAGWDATARAFVHRGAEPIKHNAGMDQRARLGRYSLVRRVGAGGFATVWLAYDEQLDAEVAIKVLSDNWIDENDVRRRFVAEGRFLRRVESPYVVGVHDIGETDDGRPYLVLTYADGGSLAERIKAGPLAIGAVIEVVAQIGAGLGQLHDRGVLHRDVKPANVLFRTDPDGERAMLGDLGLGKSLDTVSQLTMPGGTPAYAAPEQVMGDRLDPRADLYSLGAVTYAALTGQAPHGAISLGAVLRIDTPPPRMATLRPEISPALDAVVRRALQPDRELRWPDLPSFLNALQKAYETGEAPTEEFPAVVGTAAAGTAAAGPSDGTAGESPNALAVPATVVAMESDGQPAAGPPGWRTWVAALLAAAVLGGAGGYGGYTFILRRPVEVRGQDFSVAVPRAWGELSESSWQPVAGQGEQPALLVTRSVDGWRDSDVPGVFLGVQPLSTLPESPGLVPQGCISSGSENPTSQERRWLSQCDNSFVIDTFRLVGAGQGIRIQVRAADKDSALEVLDSVRYNPN